jgi:hypothetical protein
MDSGKPKNQSSPPALKLVKEPGHGELSGERPKSELGKFFTALADAIDRDIEKILAP